MTQLQSTPVSAKGLKLFTVCLALVLMASSLVAIVSNISLVAKRSDFVSFYTGAKIVSIGQGSNLYSLAFQDRVQTQIGASFPIAIDLLPFRNPPFVAAAFMPFTLIELVPAYMAFLVVNVVLVIGFALVSSTLLKPLGGFALVVFMLALSRAAIINLQLGQLSAVMLAVVLALYIAAKTNRNFMLGVVSGLVMVKPQFALILPFMFLMSSAKSAYIKGLASCLVVLAVISLVISGRGVWDYPALLITTETSVFASPWWRMYSLIPLINTILESLMLHGWVMVPIVAYAYVAVLAVFHRSVAKVSPAISLLLVCSVALAFSPHTLGYDLLIFACPAVALLGEARGSSGSRRWVLFGVAMLLWCLPLTLFFKVTAYFAPLPLLVSLLLFAHESSVAEHATIMTKDGRSRRS